MQQNNEEEMVSRVGFEPDTTTENTGIKGVMDNQQVPQVQESPIRCTNSVQSGCEKVSPVVAQIIADQAREIDRLRSAFTDIANLCWDAKRHIRNMYPLLAEDDVDDISRICAQAIGENQAQTQPFENLEELRLKAEFLDRMIDDPEERVTVVKGHRPTDGPQYFVLYRDTYYWFVETPPKVLFHASGRTLIEAIRNFLACEGTWKKKKAPDESGA